MKLRPHKRHANVNGFVLAGGASARMGRDKALLELKGVPMLVRTVGLIQPLVARAFVVGPPERYDSLGLEMVQDHWPATGPLGGIATALRSSMAEWNLILSCDLPYLTSEWISWLLDRAQESSSQAVVPASQRGLEPLVAVYRKSCGSAFEAALASGVRRVTEALETIAFERVEAHEWCGVEARPNLFHNLNTPEDFAAVCPGARGDEAPHKGATH